MGYRQILIKRCEKLSFKDNQLVVRRDDEDTKIPLEDINYILLEDSTTVVTSRLLAELGKFSIALLICDEKHIPTSVMFPYNHHYKQLEILELQLENTIKMKDELWKLIIKNKIENQKKLLIKKTTDEYTIDKLEDFILEVEPGDIGNREGLASKMYFRSLFGSEFIRHYDDVINATLNYGYTILLSALVRLVSSYGLLTYYGINHKSKTNNFNLPCDLVEPFRPIVDCYVINNINKLSESLSYETRKELVKLINNEVVIEGKRCTVEYAMELLVKSYIKALSTGEVKLSLIDPIYD